MDHAQHAHAVEAGGWWSYLLGGGFMPHGHCYAWRPDILWLHVASDALIAIAYYSIPIILISFVARRRDVPFNWMFVLFGVFIFACGTTHLIEIVSVGEPVYKLGGLMKALTAAVSMAAAVMLVPLMPKALALPSLRSAHRELQATAGELQRGNASQIAQVFQNLVGNALKFAGQGPPQVQVSARRQGGEWMFTVQDQGIGIDPRHHDRIFALFQRLHSASDYPGTGIGLAVCKKIVERHGRRSWVESTSGSGARFCFTLPADTPADAPAAQAAP